MRLSRRAALLLGAGASAGAVAAAFGHRAMARVRGADEPVAITVDARPIAAFDPRASGETHFGALAFRSGLVLTSRFEGFGGFSGLWRSPDGGAELVALTDNGMWLTARPATEAGRIVGLREARMAPILGLAGESLRHTRAYDTEALAIANGVAYVGIEGAHEVRRFDWAGQGVLARGAPLPLPAETQSLPRNASFEAVAVAPPGHPLAGSVVAIAEEARPGDAEATLGWVITGPRQFRFEVARTRGFAITDAAFLPEGDLLLLERRYRILTGVACRIRRVARDAVAPGATLDGPVLFEADRAFEIDNMEGLALHRDPSSGQTILTLISDDNFSPVQRTLLLEFALAPG